MHSEGQAANGTDPSQGYIQFTGTITGGPTNRLTLTTTTASANHGSYVLSGANTFSGAIDLNGGRLTTDIIQDGGNFDSSFVTSYPNATFGTGDIHLVSQSPLISGAVSRMTIPSGVLNAIGDNATLTIDGINNGLRASFAELGNGIDERVGHLVLGGTTELNGVTYGSSTSGAIFQDDTYFTGNGEIQTGILGDFNGDGVVNAADYAVWRKSYSSNLALFSLWQANFGNVSGAGSSGGGLKSAAVPEPASMVLALFALLLLAPRKSNGFTKSA
jgi:autotransporter-associated beta strand protein